MDKIILLGQDLVYFLSKLEVFKVILMTVTSKNQPEETDPSFPQWDFEKSLVLTWLLNSMQPHFSKSYLLLNMEDSFHDIL